MNQLKNQTALGVALSAAGVKATTASPAPPPEKPLTAAEANAQLAAAQQPAERKQRESRKAPYADFEAAAKLLGCSTRDLGERIGYSRHASSTWQVEGECPYVAVVAAQALAKLHTSGEPATNQKFILTIWADGQVTSEPMGTEVITLNGAQYVKLAKV